MGSYSSLYPQALSLSLAGIAGRGPKRKSPEGPEEKEHIVCACANYLGYRARIHYPRKYIGGIRHGCIQK